MAFAARAVKILGLPQAVYPIPNYMSRAISRPTVANRPHSQHARHSQHNGTPLPAVFKPQLKWSRGRKRVSVAYRDHEVRVELDLGRCGALCGPWAWRLEIDGQPIEPIGDWEETCSVKRRRAVYLELAIELTHERRLERHILLAPRDGFLFLADAVVGELPAAIEYRATLPLAEGARFESAAENQEGWLATDRHRAALLPLALPEWRGDSRHGSLATAAGTIEVRRC
jgi:hypothetical protein